MTRPEWATRAEAFDDARRQFFNGLAAYAALLNHGDIYKSTETYVRIALASVGMPSTIGGLTLEMPLPPYVFDQNAMLEWEYPRADANPELYELAMAWKAIESKAFTERAEAYAQSITGGDVVMYGLSRGVATVYVFDKDYPIPAPTVVLNITVPVEREGRHYGVHMVGKPETIAQYRHSLLPHFYPFKVRRPPHYG